MGLMKVGLAVVAALAVAVPDADAGGRGRGGGGARSSSSGARHASGPHHHHRGAVFVGGYYGYRAYYPAFYYPYPYYPYNEVPLYPPTPTDPYLYYCRAANAYYPYVQACAGGWERYLAGEPLS